MTVEPDAIANAPFGQFNKNPGFFPGNNPPYGPFMIVINSIEDPVFIYCRTFHSGGKTVYRSQ
jgi:hypothetical protein